MRRTHLGVQAAIVLAMVTLVSWPQFRPVHAQTVWRYSPDALAQAEATDVQRFGGDVADQNQKFGGSSSAYTAAGASSTASRSDIDRSAPYVPPIGVMALGGKLNALIGFAMNSLKVPIPYARVVLRNIRTGQVLARTVADSQGHFSFLDLNSEMYVVELLGPDGAVVATSSMMTLARGELRQTELLVPAMATTVAAAVGNTYNSTLQQATAVAASTGVTRTTTSLASAITPS